MRKKGHIQASFDRDVAEMMRGFRRPQTVPIEFEWKPLDKKKLPAARCWNGHFWYGDGESATERSVIVRRKDFDALVKIARKAKP